MSIVNGWCKIEGAIVHDTQKAYNYTLISPLAYEPVFYGSPTVRIQNKTSTILGVVYKVVPIKDFAGFSSVQQIDLNYNAFQNALVAYSRTINFYDPDYTPQLYHEEFALTESSVIFYDDSTQTSFSKYAIVYIDKNLTPPITAMIAKYVGNSIPVGNEFNEDDLQIHVEYDDGSLIRVKTGYTLTPASKVINIIGDNNYVVSLVSEDDTLFTANLVIPGIKSLTSITAIYDGPTLYQGQIIERKYLVVTAYYSDGSSNTVTNYSFLSGDTVGTQSYTHISYNGETCKVDLPIYTIKSSRLIAYYSGPNVEVNESAPYSFDLANVLVKIHYESADGKNGNWETISPSSCTFTPTTIQHEGDNEILVEYEGKNGYVKCYMIVPGIKPVTKMTDLIVQYTGVPVVQGKSYSLERLIVKAYYSDGTTAIIKNGYQVSSNIITKIGVNTFTCTYTDRPSSGEDVTLKMPFDIVGIEKESTTDTTYSPISLQNHYPEATRLNNRYRGPGEAVKHQDIDRMLYENIHALYDIFANIENSYNLLVATIEGNQAVKYFSINQINKAQDMINDITSEVKT